MPGALGESCCTAMRESLSVSAGWWNAAVVTLGCLASHAFFLYAQLSGMASDCGPPPTPTCPLHGNLDPGGLLVGGVYAHIDYEAGGWLAAGLSEITGSQCYDHDKYLDCPLGTRTPLPANLDDTLCSLLECGGFDFTANLLHLSYIFSIHELWNERTGLGCGDLDLDKCIYPGRPAAGTLFGWSFVWPHVKLVLLQILFYLPFHAPFRRNCLYWTAFFGKWSLADVLVMAAVLGILDLRVDKGLVELWDGISPHFLPLCDVVCLEGFFPAANGSFLNVSFIDFRNGSAPLPLSNCSVACSAAKATLSLGITDGTLPASRLEATLRVEGLSAMYAFCIAVILSLITSTYVDTLDDRLRDGRRKASQRGGSVTSTLSIVLPLPTSVAPTDVGSMSPQGVTMAGRSSGAGGLPAPLPGVSMAAPPAALEAAAEQHSTTSNTGNGPRAPLLQPPASAAAKALPAGTDTPTEAPPFAGARVKHPVAGSRRRWEPLQRLGHGLLVLVQLVLVLGFITVPSFSRRVEGSFGSLLEDIGLELNYDIPLWVLPALTARGGGLHWLMALTFTFFIIVAPVLRALSLLALLWLPMRPDHARWLHVQSRRLVNFTALDVMLVATPLIGITFGPVTEYLLRPEQIPLCNVLNHVYGSGNTCLRIAVDPLAGYWFNVAAVVVMIVSGFDGSPTSKFIHRHLYPYDQQPPPSLQCVD